MKSSYESWRERDSSHQSDLASGSVWTSFSDLFTSLAIIFLILFVVSLLKLSLSRFEAAKSSQEHQEFLEGRISKSQEELQAKRDARIQGSFKELTRFKYQIHVRSQELNQMMEGLISHQKALDQLLVEQRHKDKVMSNFNNMIEKKNKIIERQKNSLSKGHSKYLKTEIKLTEVSKKLDQEKKKSDQVVNYLQAEIQLTRDQLSLAKKESQEKAEKINKLKRSINHKEEDLVRQLKKLDLSEVKRLEIKERVDIKNKEIHELKDLIVSMRNSLNLSRERERTYRKLASEKGVSNEADSTRNRIGANLAEKFKKAGMNIATDKKTGRITLFMDEAFLFVNDSFELTESIKEKLKSILPIYTEELFREKVNRDNISSVNVVGHASPRYGGGFVSPVGNQLDAYFYNLQLSSNRAVQIVKFIASPESGEFSFKNA